MSRRPTAPARPLRSALRLRGGPERPLEEMAGWVETGGRPSAGAVVELGERLGLPPAAVRAALSFYAGFAARPDARRVCRGTSCALAGEGAIEGRLGEVEPMEGPAGRMPAEGRPVEGVYCLGACHASPVYQEADGSLRAPEGAVPRPEVRSAAARPVVVRNLLGGAAADLAAARRRGVWAGLEAGLERGGSAVLEELEASGERGRGGAGFPTGAKWRACAAAAGGDKLVVANGDEGDPGSFIDRLLMEDDPHSVLEGMALAGLAVGAARGIVFVRREYPAARRRLEAAVDEARGAGILGRQLMGRGPAFDVEIFPAHGSYVCGEETALLNALEGLRGEVRLRPPYPVEAGLDGRPTVVNNVETLVNVPWIVHQGAAAYRALGTRESAGTKALCLNAGFARPGVLEVEMGTSLRWVVEEAAGGGRGGEALALVLLGGPMGSALAPDEWDVPLCYEAMGKRGVVLGHGGLVAVPVGTDPALLLHHWLCFVQDESCGKCVPCRLGSQRALEMVRDGLTRQRRRGMERVLELMERASLCAFGQLTPGPMRRLLELFDREVGGAGSGS